MLSGVLLLALLGAPGAEAAVEPPEPQGPRRVLVLDFKTTSSDQETARIVTDLVAISLGRREQFEVLTSADLRQVAALEAEKQTMGCDEDSTSCLAELAGALGAERVVFGNVGRLGELTLVTMTLFASDEARSLGRRSVEVERHAELPRALESAVASLLGEAALPPPEEPSPLLSPLFLGGAGAGALLLVGATTLSVLAALDNGTLGSVEETRAAKDEALARGPFLVFGAVGLGVLAAGAGVVAVVPFLGE